MPGPDLLAAATRIARERLAPGAAAVDAGTVRREDLDALGAAGLLGAATAPPSVFRAVQEVLAGADAATWFVQAQHHYPVRLLADPPSPALAAMREDLLAGRRVAGVAFSHLRRWPARPLEATRVQGGWRFAGQVPWFTGWGLNDVLALGAATADGEVLFALVEARESDRLQATPHLRLAVMSAACTVSLQVDALFVPDELVMHRTSVAQWQAGDLRTTVNANPAVLGVAQAATNRLALLGEDRGLAQAVDLAARLHRRLADVRSTAYALADRADAEPAHALSTRLQAQRLCLQATGALVAAGGGASMALDDPAQRWAREALFLLVQGQTRPAREAALGAWA